MKCIERVPHTAPTKARSVNSVITAYIKILAGTYRISIGGETVLYCTACPLLSHTVNSKGTKEEWISKDRRMHKEFQALLIDSAQVDLDVPWVIYINTPFPWAGVKRTNGPV